MTEEQIALSRRAIACKGWRWMPGMLRVWPFVDRTPIQQSVWSCFASDEDRARGYIESMPIERVDDHPLSIEPMERWNDAADQWVMNIPDLTDPATLGCLLALVREAHGSPKIMFEGQTYASVLYVVCGSGNYYIRRDCGDGEEDLYVDGVWSANVRHGVDEVSCATEAEALVAALEAAQ